MPRVGMDFKSVIILWDGNTSASFGNIVTCDDGQEEEKELLSMRLSGQSVQIQKQIFSFCVLRAN